MFHYKHAFTLLAIALHHRNEQLDETHWTEIADSLDTFDQFFSKWKMSNGNLIEFLYEIVSFIHFLSERKKPLCLI